VKESDVTRLHRIHERDGGTFSLNQLFLFETEMDWVVSRIKSNEAGNAKDQTVVLSVCDARNSAVLATFTDRLSNVLAAAISSATGDTHPLPLRALSSFSGKLARGSSGDGSSSESHGGNGDVAVVDDNKPDDVFRDQVREMVLGGNTSVVTSDPCLQATQQRVWMTPSGVSNHNPMLDTTNSNTSR
jgi:hypothetical protein